MRNILLIVAFSLIVCGCTKDKQPKDILEREKFESLYVELLDSAAITERDSANISISTTAQRILNRREITLAQLKATVGYYNEDSERWKEFYGGVVKKVNEQYTKNPTR